MESKEISYSRFVNTEEAAKIGQIWAYILFEKHMLYRKWKVYDLCQNYFDLHSVKINLETEVVP